MRVWYGKVGFGLVCLVQYGPVDKNHQNDVSTFYDGIVRCPYPIICDELSAASFFNNTISSPAPTFLVCSVRFHCNTSAQVCQHSGHRLS